MSNNNIGTLRFTGAFLVLFGHSFTLSAGKISVHDPVSNWLMAYTPFHKALPGIGVMMFFVISGYLITASFQRRRNLLDFITARTLRIYPALIIAVIFCVLMGLYFTTLPATEYLGHRGTWRFLLQNSALVYGIHFHLPGVFADLPWKHGINGSLWTLPIEIGMYFYVFILGVARILNNRSLFNVTAIALVALFVANPQEFPLLSRPGHAYLGLSFLLGSVLYINRELFRYRGKGLVILLLLSLMSYNTRFYDIVSLTLFAYALLLLGLSEKFKLPRLDKYGDFSYGLYLYAFPMQQTAIHFLGGEDPWLINAVALCAALALAIFSWRYIESPILSKRAAVVTQLSQILARPRSFFAKHPAE